MTEVISAAVQPKISFLDGARIYEKLRRNVMEAGILNRSYVYYAFMGTGFLTAIISTAYALYAIHNLFLFVIFGVIFAFCLGQIGGFMHDAGHRAIFKSTKMNDIVGGICASILFFNYRAWKQKHNAHHAHPNQEDTDPDVELPLFAFTQKRFNSKKGISRFVQRYQAYLYLPMSMLLAYSMQFKSSIKYFIVEIKKGFRPGIIPEMIVFAVFFFIWYVLPFLVLGISKGILLIIVVPVCIGFYMANIFAPNHKGMPEFEKDAKVSFIEQQIVTSRNVKPGWLTDFVYFGLNYQIEHHLFPDCPRNKLKKVTPFVKQLCREAQLPFTVAGAFESFKIILGELNKTAKAAKGA
jgi:fatty acid desaturase